MTEKDERHALSAYILLASYPEDFLRCLSGLSNDALVFLHALLTTPNPNQSAENRRINESGVPMVVHEFERRELPVPDVATD